MSKLHSEIDLTKKDKLERFSIYSTWELFGITCVVIVSLLALIMGLLGFSVGVVRLVQSGSWSWRHPAEFLGVALGLLVLIVFAFNAFRLCLIPYKACIEPDGLLVIHRARGALRVEIKDVSVVEIFEDEMKVDKRSSMQIHVNGKRIDLHLFSSYLKFIAALQRHNPSISVRRF